MSGDGVHLAQWGPLPVPCGQTSIRTTSSQKEVFTSVSEIEMLFNVHVIPIQKYLKWVAVRVRNVHRVVFEDVRFVFDCPQSRVNIQHVRAPLVRKGDIFPWLEVDESESQMQRSKVRCGESKIRGDVVAAY